MWQIYQNGNQRIKELYMPNIKKKPRENEAFYEDLRKQNLANRLTPEHIAYIAYLMRQDTLKQLRENK